MSGVLTFVCFASLILAAGALTGSIAWIISGYRKGY